MKRINLRRKEVSYAQIAATPQSPPVSIAVRVPPPPAYLWVNLPAERQQRVLHVLSRLISQHLQPSGRREVAHEEQ